MTDLQVVYERPPREGERCVWHVVDGVPASSLGEALIWAEAYGATGLDGVGSERLLDGRRVTIRESVSAGVIA